jgi:hypothetical protein
LFVLCAGFTLLLREDTPTRNCIWHPCPECHEASKHHLLKFGSFSYWFDTTLVSHLREDLLLCSSYLLLGFPTGRSSTSSTPHHQVAKELPVLSGEALREQQAWLNELLSEASKQQEAFKKANPGAGASQYIVSVGGAGARSRVQASSPHQGARHAGSVTSGHRDKQIQVYDPAIAGKQEVMQGNAGQGDRHVGNKNAGQNYPTGQGACSAGGGRHNNVPRYSAQVQHQQQQGAGYAVQHQG